jgi:hypothetical protein
MKAGHRPGNAESKKHGGQIRPAMARTFYREGAMAYERKAAT